MRPEPPLLPRKRSNLIEKCRAASRSRAVVDLPGTTQFDGAPYHADERSHADPPRNENAIGRILVVWKIVAGHPGGQDVTNLHLFMYELRSATAFDVSTYGDDIPLPLILRVSQRVAADKPIREMQRDVCTSRERWQQS